MTKSKTRQQLPKKELKVPQQMLKSKDLWKNRKAKRAPKVGLRKAEGGWPRSARSNSIGRSASLRKRKSEPSD